MNHILKGIRSVFYSQNELEKRGWDLIPSEQRKWENFTHNTIAGLFSLGLGGLCISFLFYSQTETSFNHTISSICVFLSYLFGGMFLFGLIGLLTIKQ